MMEKFRMARITEEQEIKIVIKYAVNNISIENFLIGKKYLKMSKRMK